MRYNETDNVEISCVIESNSIPEIEWISNNNQTLNTYKNETSILLLLNSIKRIDTGIYDCRIKNESVNISDTVEIIVQCNF